MLLCFLLRNWICLKLWSDLSLIYGSCRYIILLDLYAITEWILVQLFVFNTCLPLCIVYDVLEETNSDVSDVLYN